MDAGVHHQPTRPEGNGLEIAESSDRIVLIRAQLISQLLGVERPPLRVGIEAEDLADERHLVGILALPDMPRDRLVIGEIAETVSAVEVRGPEIDPETARD